MNFVTADQTMLARLQGIEEPVEIRDPNGKVLGLYTPVPSPETAAYQPKAEDLFDLKEAEHILATQRDQGRPLKEVMQHLRSLGEPG